MSAHLIAMNHVQTSRWWQTLVLLVLAPVAAVGAWYARLTARYRHTNRELDRRKQHQNHR